MRVSIKVALPEHIPPLISRQTRETSGFNFNPRFRILPEFERASLSPTKWRVILGRIARDSKDREFIVQTSIVARTIGRIKIPGGLKRARSLFFSPLLCQKPIYSSVEWILSVFGIFFPFVSLDAVISIERRLAPQADYREHFGALIIKRG